MAHNSLDVVAHEHDDGTRGARVTVRSDATADVGANLDAESAEAHIRAVADAFGWTVTITDPGVVDSPESGG